MQKNPKIYYYNVTYGSGVEATGNRIGLMFNEYKKQHPKKFISYRLQNPPHTMLKDLAENKPDIIIMNELHQRVMIAVHAYKILKPKTKIILLNHCYPYLTDFPVPEDSVLFEWCSEDGAKDINDFLRKGVDHIINLNHRPKEKEIHSVLKERVVEKYFPIEDDFRIYVPWNERPKDFFFFGSVYPIKLSGEFVEKFSKTNMSIDVYGKWRRDPENETMLDYNKYKRMIIESSAFNYKGIIPDGDVFRTLNQYKFFVMPHDGPEPFCLCLAEAIRCGCIPLVVNDRNRNWGKWIDWAEDCMVEYQSVDKLIEKMYYYIKNKNSEKLIDTLHNRSNEISSIMRNRTDFNTFKAILLDLIFKK